MAVCAGAMIAELGRVATDDRIAPRSENLSSPMTRHRRRALRSHDSEGFARPQLERAIALTCRMDSRTHRMSVRAAIDSEGQGHRPVALEACQTSRCATTAKVKVFIRGTAQLEIASPTAVLYIEIILTSYTL